MKLDENGCIMITVHKICISNYAKDKYITTMPSLQWTSNLNLACCFDNELEALEYEERADVEAVIGDEYSLLIWTDTKQSIYDVEYLSISI